MRLHKALILISLSLISLGAEARELSNNYFSVRAMGMGNAYTAVVSDSDALFYNPASLSRVDGVNWTILDPKVGVNGIEAYTKFQEVSDAEDLATMLNEFYGQYIWVGGSGKTAFTVPHLGFAAYGAADIALNLTNPAYPSMNLNYIADYGYALGFSFPLLPGFSYFGLTAKRISRSGTNLPLGPAVLGTLDSEAIAQQIQNRGTGYSLDAGWNITIPGPVKPTLSAVMRDIGNTQFTHEGGATAPPSNQSELIVGASLEVDALLVSVTPAIEIRHLNNATEPLGKKLHLGVELDLPLIDIRAGLHQGYYTLGVGLSLGLIRFDAATYGVEVGEYPGQQEDRRYVVQATIELGFDPMMFSLSGGGKNGSGGGRRLKQRR